MSPVNQPDSRTVAIVGASSDPERYANKAQKLLTEKGYPVIPVSRKEKEILGVTTITELAQITTPPDTVTLYVGPAAQPQVIEQILTLKPKRVIFNPGTENPAAYDALDAAGIGYEEACTLVLLRTGVF